MEAIVLLLVWLQSGAGFQSIHELEVKAHRPLAHLSERQWDSVWGYQARPGPARRQTSTCALNRQVMGYYPYWMGTAYTSFPWNLLSTIVFFSYEVDPATGTYTNPTVINTWRTTSLVPTAQSNGVEVQLCATLFGGTNLTTFLTTPAARLRCIDSLVSLIAQRNAQGVNIDFEGLPSSQRTAFVSFMQQLRDTLNRRRPGAKLSVALPAVDWSNAYDVSALSGICDQLFIMGYDFYWSTAPTAGPTGLLHVGQLWGGRCNSRTIVDYLASGAARSKLILGVPYYGFRYPTTTNTYPASTTGSGVSRLYHQAYAEANTYGWNWDSHSRSRYFMYQSGGQWYQTWWHDSLSLAWIYRTALMQGIAGVGMWALGYDGSRTELWGALKDHFTDCAVVACQDTFFDMGGPLGSYFNRENWTWTLAPTGASQVSVTFHTFQLENGYDTLWIYDGPTTTSPQIGYYTGSASPGTVTGSSGSLTFRYKSDGATVAPGWLATWNCVLDNQPPTTAIAPLRPWYAQDFVVSFTDADNLAVVQRYVCIADYSASRWGANPTKGFAYEDFPGTTLPPGWVASVGSWSVASGYLTQSDETQSNTNLYFPLAQDASTQWLYHWRMRLSGTGTNRRAGLHLFVSDPTLSQRGDSYLLWFRLDNQRIEIYRITGNALPSPQYQQPYPFVANTWYDIKAVYDPTTGQIQIWINNALVGSWTDPAPLQSGGYVSLRTGNALVDYDELRVYRSRGSTFAVQVGSGGHARYESANPTTPAVRVLSLVRDAAGLWSAGAAAESKIDWTAPTTALSVSGWKTADFVQAFSEADALSGVGRRFLLPAYLGANGWEASTAAGFLYDDFTGVQGGWTAGAGTWSTSAGLLTQSDATSTGTNYYRSVAQGSLALYRVKARLTNSTGNRRWGFHILVDDPTQSQRGNSYLIWLRYDQQDVQIYETIANTLYTRLTVPFSLSVGTDYLVEVVYDSGWIGVWVNGTWVGEWTDATPLTAGGYISLRTNQAQVEWDFVEVWRGRGASETITVGPSGWLAAQNPTPTTSAGRLYSRVYDVAGNPSSIASAGVDVDWTLPSAVPAVRDGAGPDEGYTTDGTQLTGNWDASSDPHSGVVAYEYAIGTAAGLTDVRGWTDVGAVTSYTATGLSLTPGQTYYWGVRARNGANLVGPSAWSNGILYDPNPLAFSPSFSGEASRPVGLRLYPNPARETLVLEIPDSLPASEGYLIDAAGRVIQAFSVERPQQRLSVAALPRGLYGVWIPPYPVLRFLRE